MRQQQINLLAPMLRKPHARFSARLALRLCALAAAVCGALWLSALAGGASLIGQQADLESRRDAATQELQQLAAQRQAAGANVDLAAEQARLTAERDRKLAVLAALARHQLGNTRGFSPQLAGFSRQRVNGLWLNRVELWAGGRDIALTGTALSQELIPRYLEALGREESFAGTQFQHALLQGAGPAGLTFELRTRTTP